MFGRRSWCLPVAPMGRLPSSTDYAVSRLVCPRDLRFSRTVQHSVFYVWFFQLMLQRPYVCLFLYYCDRTPLSGHSTPCLSIHKVMNIWVISRAWLFQTHDMCRYILLFLLWRNRSTRISRTYGKTLLETMKMFYNVTAQIPKQCTKTLAPPSPQQCWVPPLQSILRHFD